MKSTLLFLCVSLAGKPVTSFSQAANVQDSMALIDLYNATDGDHWSQPWGWKGRLYWPFPFDPSGSVPVYTNSLWQGVQMNLSARVTRLYRAGNNLNGEIPASLGNLSMLDTLELGDNAEPNYDLRGQVPAFSKLKYLNITGTSISSIGSISSLQQLYADACAHLDLSSLNGLSGLKKLSLVGCGLVSVPSSLLQLSSLSYLNVDNNKLTFDVTEQLADNPWFYFGNQAPLKISAEGKVLSVHAGGTLSKNIYNWYRIVPGKSDELVYQAQGDSTFTPDETGTYRAYIFQLNHPQAFYLNSDTLHINTDPDKLDVQVIDPYPSAIDKDGNISKTISKIDLNKEVTGASADGVTKVLLVVQSDNPVTFYLNDSKDGSLNNLDDQGATANTIISVTPESGKAVAVYTVPDGIGKSSMDAAREVDISVEASGGKHALVSLSLKTPPVVLVHGMWSNPRVWLESGFMTTLSNNGFQPFSADYEAANAATFNPNNPASLPGRSAVKEAIDVGLYVFRSNGVAATQVDVVAHSLGGLMTRSLSQQNDFINPLNYNKGTVHKLITIGTPHKGSPFGPAIWDARNKPFKLSVPLSGGSEQIEFGTLSDVLKASGNPIGSCHLDFGSQSDGIKALSKTPPYKTYAIAANYKGKGPAKEQTAGYIAINELCFTATGQTFSDIMKSACSGQGVMSNDLIVPMGSQKGFIDKDTVFWGTAHSIPAAVTETNNPLVQQKVMELLLSGDTAMFSKGFPAPSAFPLENCSDPDNRAVNAHSDIVPAGDRSRQLLSTDSGYVRIISPLPGTVFNKNDSSTITLSYKPRGGVKPASAVFLIPGLGYVAAPVVAPYSVTVNVTDAVAPGNLEIWLMARDTAGNLFADSCHIRIKTNRLLSEIFTISGADDIRLDSSVRQSSLSVSGYFANPDDEDDAGIENITYATAGTVYTTKRGGVVAVSKDGLVTALNAGTDTLVVTNGDQSLEIRVSVDSNFLDAYYYADTINFPAIPDKLLSDAPFALGAFAASGESIKYSLVGGNAELNNGVVIVKDTGLISISASAAGNAYFKPAIPVIRNFRVRGNNTATYTFTGNGNWSVVSNWADQRKPPSTLPVGSEIIIDPPINGECILDIQQTISTGAKFTVRANKKIRLNSNLVIGAK